MLVMHEAPQLLCSSVLLGFVRSVPESMSSNVIEVLRVTEELIEVVAAKKGWVSPVVWTSCPF